MGTVIDSPHAGVTISYNGLQFGGSDGAKIGGRTIRCDLPDKVSLSVEPVYDETGRAVKWLRCVLGLQTCFYASTEAALDANMALVRAALETPRRELKIEGLGLGFEAITDLDNGPKPSQLELFPLGELACQANWSVSFCVSPCSGFINLTGSEWTELSWSTSWLNDFEGITTRTISGHVSVVGGIGRVSAESARASLTIACPQGFRREQDAWQESADKRRLDFVIADVQFRGDAYPEGITAASGETSFDASGSGGAFPNSTVSISATITTAPGRDRGYAGVLFFKMLLAKQQKLIAGMNPKKGSVIPAKLSIRNGKWDNSRQTQCSASWLLTGCINDMLAAAGIWEPLDPPDYTKWRTSVQNLWDNRGTSGIGTLSSEDVVINVCNGIRQGVIGQTESKALAVGTGNSPLTFACGDIPTDGGWLQYDLQVRVLRDDQQTWHSKAIPYVIAAVSALQNPASLGGPSFTMPADQKHVKETHGLPETYVLLQFKGMRVKHWPEVPELITVGGKTAEFVRHDIERPRVAYRLFGCPVFFRRGWRLYRVNDYVASYTKNPKESECSGEINETGNY